MFTDKRSKKIVLVSHCILNQNSISDGTADFPAADRIIVDFLLKSKVGILQLPCPELNCLGLDRGDILGGTRPLLFENSRIRKAMGKSEAKEILSGILKNLLFQIEEYISHGFKIVGVIGINRSPSCGVETTSKNNEEVEGNGVFISALKKELKKQKIKIDFVGIKAVETKSSIQKLKQLLAKDNTAL